MKTPNRRSIVVPLLLCSVFAACAEPPRFLGISEPTLKDQGQHHKTWQRVSSYMTSYGRVVTRTNTYQEIGTGMSWLDREANPPVWRDTEESIEVFPAGGIARKGPHQLIISPQLAGETPTLDIMTPDGKRLLCSLFGLVYRDPVSGNNVMIAEPNPDAVATLVSSQRVVFENALLDYSASLQITYTRAGVESELILHENIDPPSEWNLSPETRLTVWSEWFDLPEVRKEVHLVAGESDALARQLMAEPDRIDETIIFGEMRLTQGSAFQVGEGASTDSIIVSKQLVEVEGRTFLIESADYREIEPMLKALDLARNAAPAPGPKLQLAKRQPAKSLTELVASVAGTRPSARDIDSFASRRSEILTSALVPAQAPAFEMARSDYQQRRGVSVDWTAVISQTNTIFKANETYFCSSLVNLAGTTVIEGGTCVKFSPTNNPAIWFLGPVDCQTSREHPAWFTAREDHSVGEIVGSITNSVGTNVYGGSTTLRFSYSGATFYLHDLRLRYLSQPIALMAGSLKLSHSQIGYGNYGVIVIGNLESEVNNVLLHDLKLAAFAGSSFHTNRGVNVTVHRSPTLKGGTSITLFLTNSLVISVTNNVVWQGTNVFTNHNDSGYFETAVSGRRYLGSDFRDLGTTNISASLLAELKALTTQPPILINTNITGNTVLSARAIADTNGLIDPGYHYPIAHYLIGPGAVGSGITLSNALLLVTNGAVVIFDSSVTNYGLRLDNGAGLVAEGGPVAMTRLMWSQNVHETPAGTNGSMRSMLADTYPGPAALPSVNLRFTDVPMICGSHLFWQENSRGVFGQVTFWDSQFRGGNIYFSPGITNHNLGWTNSLFERVRTSVYPYAPMGLAIRNCLFKEGYLGLDWGAGPTGSWSVYDCQFDTTNIYQNPGAPVVHNNNSYISGQYRLSPTNLQDVVASPATFEKGRLGDYYQLTNSPLIEVGSRNASNGFYHYTSTWNPQSPETNSILNIGLLYVALGADDLPADHDQDGIPTYLEDGDNDGALDAGESCWHDPILTIAGSLNYIKGSPPKLLDTNATVTDAFSPDFGSGQLTVTITAGAHADDRLGIRHQGTNAAQVGVSGTNVTYASVTIGNFTGGTGTNKLVVSFNTNATPAIAQALVRNFTFHNVSNNPALSTRTLRFDLTDGDGGTNQPVYQTINIICPAAIDAMLVLDVSQSLSLPNFTNAMESASSFVSRLNVSTDRAGLISFAHTAELEIGLTNNFSAVQAAILSLAQRTGTLIHPPLHLARTNLSGTASNTLPLLVLFSDGEINNNPAVNTNEAKNAAITNKEAGIRIITVAYEDSEQGTNLMRELASSLSDAYYASSVEVIETNFTTVAQALCRANTGPYVEIIAPTNASFYPIPPTNVALSAVAFDANGHITNFGFYAGATRIDSVVDTNSHTYTLDWRPKLGGTNTVTARVADNHGAEATSAAVTFVVNHPPTVSITSPTNKQVFARPNNDITIQVSASDVEASGSVTNVELFRNDVLIGTDNTVPYTFSWMNAPTGTFVLAARAWDNHGASKTSIGVTITVHPTNAPPFVYAGTNQTIRLPATAALLGEVRDDGLPHGSALSILWSQISGPSSVTFSNANLAGTTATFSQPGTNVLRLTASDSVFTNSSYVTNVILNTNATPIVNAGPDQTLILGAQVPFTSSTDAGATHVSWDTKGREFWLAFQRNIGGETTPRTMLLIVADEDSNVNIVTGSNFATNVFVSAGSLGVVDLIGAQIVQPDVTNNLGIHVMADHEITVYGLNQSKFSTDGFLGFPADVLGTNYFVATYNGGDFSVVATRPDTQITIMASTTTTSFGAAGTNLTLYLDEGQAFMLELFEGELTGSMIVSDKPIAVLAGHRCRYLPDHLPCDHLIDQLPPVYTWGKEFVTVPFARGTNGDVFRILASQDATTIGKDGAWLTNLNKGQFIEFVSTQAMHITASKPILPVQFMTSATFESNGDTDYTYGDPLMQIVPPYEQFMSEYTITASTITNFTAHYVNVVGPRAITNQIRLDGTNVASANFSILGNSGFAMA